MCHCMGATLLLQKHGQHRLLAARRLFVQQVDLGFHLLALAGHHVTFLSGLLLPAGQDRMHRSGARTLKRFDSSSQASGEARSN